MNPSTMCTQCAHVKQTDRGFCVWGHRKHTYPESTSFSAPHHVCRTAGAPTHSILLHSFFITRQLSSFLVDFLYLQAGSARPQRAPAVSFKSFSCAEMILKPLQLFVPLAMGSKIKMDMQALMHRDATRFNNWVNATIQYLGFISPFFIIPYPFYFPLLPVLFFFHHRFLRLG